MIYKIDTKENFSVITPQISEINSNMADELIVCCDELQKDDKSAIIDFVNVESIDADTIKKVEAIHPDFYSKNLSFALCNLSAGLRSSFSQEVNITPTLIEAIDIISMEGLERELMGDF